MRYSKGNLSSPTAHKDAAEKVRRYEKQTEKHHTEALGVGIL
jgi:anti-sigma factor ChrR (cupin superfamily)